MVPGNRNIIDLCTKMNLIDQVRIEGRTTQQAKPIIDEARNFETKAKSNNSINNRMRSGQ